MGHGGLEDFAHSTCLLLALHSVSLRALTSSTLSEWDLLLSTVHTLTLRCTFTLIVCLYLMPDLDALQCPGLQ